MYHRYPGVKKNLYKKKSGVAHVGVVRAAQKQTLACRSHTLAAGQDLSSRIVTAAAQRGAQGPR